MEHGYVPLNLTEQTPFATDSGGQRANHSVMTHPVKDILEPAEKYHPLGTAVSRTMQKGTTQGCLHPTLEYR